MSKTYVTTTRLDARDITTICQWMVSRGIAPASRTAPIAVAVETFAKLIRKDSSPPTVHAAYAYLEAIGLLSDPRTKRAITKGLQSEALTEFNIEDDFSGSYVCPPKFGKVPDATDYAPESESSIDDYDDETIQAAIQRRQAELAKAQTQFSEAGGIDMEEES
jgi:hypothetical protein